MLEYVGSFTDCKGSRYHTFEDDKSRIIYGLEESYIRHDERRIARYSLSLSRSLEIIKAGVPVSYPLDIEIHHQQMLRDVLYKKIGQLVRSMVTESSDDKVQRIVSTYSDPDLKYIGSKDPLTLTKDEEYGTER